MPTKHSFLMFFFDLRGRRRRRRGQITLCEHMYARTIADVARCGSGSQPASLSSLRKTTDAAKVEGLVAPDAWPGLGELPPDLPPDFRTPQDFERLGVKGQGALGMHTAHASR